MTPGMQRLIVALVILGAGAYLALRAWRQAQAAKRQTAGGCGSDCGCGPH